MSTEIEQSIVEGDSSPSFLFNDPVIIYKNRAERLKELAQTNDFAEYLNFLSDLCKSQAILAEELLNQKFDKKEKISIQKTFSVLEKISETRELDSLFKKLLQNVPCTTNELKSIVENLNQWSTDQIVKYSIILMDGDFGQIDLRFSPFISAFLQVMSSTEIYSTYSIDTEFLNSLQIPKIELESNTEIELPIRDNCPMCNSPFVCGVIYATGEIKGLRYLHCSLCETEWKYTRLQCVACESQAHLSYYHIDGKNEGLKVEVCENCGHYTKLIYLEKLPQAEPIADDLDGIYLDLMMNEKGIHPYSFNFFLLPLAQNM